MNVPYTDDGLNDHNQIIDTIEAFGFLMFVNWIWRRIRTRHILAGIVLIISIVAGFLFLVNDNYGDNSFCVWSFWICVLTGIISLGKVMSR